MKKLFISALALAALTAVSCNKEVEMPVEPGTHPVSIIATLSEETKTAYENEKTFSWVEGDHIYLLVSKDEDGSLDYIRMVAESSGTTVKFSGDCPDGYTPISIATYPKDTGNTNYSSDLQYQKSGDYPDSYRLWGTITPDLANPMGSIPLIGLEQPDGTFSFKTATGILKFTVSNIPADAYFFQLDAPSGTNLNGYFNLSNMSVINMSDAVAGWPQKYVYFTPEAEGETRDFYLPIPVGTVPAGSTISIRSSSRGVIELATTAKDIEVVRNQVIRIPAVTCPDAPAETWTYLGTGKFIDTFVWSENNFGDQPVDVAIYYDATYDQYKMPNPYVIAAEQNGVTATGADEEFFFTVADKGRISHDWLNMGLPLSKNASATWAMISGKDVAGYGNDNTHVVSYNADGSLAQIQIAPCYRTSDENTTGAPSSYDNEIGKDHNNGIIEISFPGAQMLTPFAIASDHVTVSANHTGDGTGAAGLVDNKLDTYWHTPWSDSYPSNPDPTYGQYVTVSLSEYASTIAFAYCTRNTAAQTGAPALVVVGASTDGTNYEVIGTFSYDFMTSSAASTWVGLPTLAVEGYTSLRFGIAKTQGGADLRDITDPSTQWCNLAELMVYGISTGQAIEFKPTWLEDGQDWIKAEQVTVNSDCSKYDGTGIFDGGGYASLVDGDKDTFWHSSWTTGYDDYYDQNVDFDTTYGITIDVALGGPLKDFHFSYYARSQNNNGIPRAIIIAGSNDGSSWTDLATIEDDTLMKVNAGGRVNLPSVHASSFYNYLRLGIIKAGNGDTPTDLRGANGGFTSLAEILLFPE